MSAPRALTRSRSRSRSRVRPRSASRLAATLLLALAAACGGGSGPADDGPIGPDATPLLTGVYDLSTVNNHPVPYTTVDAQNGPVHLRGEITSGTVTLKADSTYTSAMRGRLWNNGTLTSDRVTTGGGTWSLTSAGRVRFVPGSGVAPYEMDLADGPSLRHMRRVVEDGGDATWPYVYRHR
jgi:hypothetical protein